MKSKRLRRLVASITTFSLMSTYVAADYSVEAYADQKEYSLDVSGAHSIAKGEVENLSELISNMTNENLESMYSAKDKVDIIIEFESKSILQHYTEGSMNQSITAYIQSNTGQRLSNQLTAESNEVLNDIKNNVSRNIEAKNNYNIILNGMTVEANFEDLEEIKKIEGVKNAFVATIYDLPENQEVENETNMVSSGDYVGAVEANESGYTGEGTVIAVIDSGLDVDHEAFSTMPENIKISEEDIDNIIESTELNASGNLYKNDKVPFAYDYAEGDDDTEDYNGHGTHVAGSVAANSEIIKGIAPDAQIVAMKVFGDAGGGASDATILLALEDAITLGVDGINMSLGSGAGFTSEANEVLNGTYDRISEAGITLIVSAGNDTTSTVNSSKGNLPLVSNPDNGVVGSPSTYEAATSVASINNISAYASYILLGEEKIRYSDSNAGTDVDFKTISGENEYVVVPGVGTSSDFEQVDVENKIALVERGQIAFTEKEANAALSGAKAIIIYDNVDGEALNMQTTGLIPMVAISKADGEKLVAAENKVLNIDESYMDAFVDSTSGLMSDFSSWGVTPDLKLKPEITAPGGSIYSSIPGGGYALNSGTSMSSPQVAGAVAVVKQYLNENNHHLTDVEKDDLIINLLMSTSSIITDTNGVAYTPRNQGSGLMNVNNAINSGAYLTSDNGKPKGELGDSVDGKYEFTFEVNNFSNKEIVYSIDTTTLTEKIISYEGENFFAQESRELDKSEVEFTFDGVDGDSIVVQAGESKEITVSISLTDKVKEELEICVNGTFIDGFVTLVADSEEEANLNIPFMGFYGDWNAAPVLDGNIYNGEGAIMYATALANFNNETGSGYYLGANNFTDGLVIDKDKIAIGSEITGLYSISALVGLLRSAEDVRYSVSDSDGTVLYENSYGQQSKSYYYSNGGFTTYAMDYYGWDAVDLDVSDEDNIVAYEDGVYNYKIAAKGVDDEEVEELVFPITIDTQLPEFISSETVTVDNKDYLAVVVQDNHYLQGIQLTDADENPLTDVIALNYDEKGSEQVIIFDKEGMEEIETLKIAMVDYANNVAISEEFKVHDKIVIPDAPVIVEENGVVTITAEGENIDRIEYSVDNSTWVEYTEPIVIEETTTIYARVVDVDGNVSDTVEHIVEIDVFTRALEIAIEEAEKVSQEELDKVVPAVVEMFNKALEEAKAVLSDENATQSEVDEAFDKLKEIMEMLSYYKGDKKELNDLYDKINTLNEEEFFEDTWIVLEEELENTKDVLGDENALEAEVAKSYEDLLRAFLGLRIKPSKEKLDELINKLENLNVENYTEQDWDKVQSILSLAKEVYNDDDATTDEINEIENDIEELLAKLEEVDTDTDNSEEDKDSEEVEDNEEDNDVEEDKDNEEDKNDEEDEENKDVNTESEEEKDEVKEDNVTEEENVEIKEEDKGEDEESESLPQTGLPGVGLAISLGLTAVASGSYLLKKKNK